MPTIYKLIHLYRTLEVNHMCEINQILKKLYNKYHIGYSTKANFVFEAVSNTFQIIGNWHKLDQDITSTDHILFECSELQYI